MASFVDVDGIADEFLEFIGYVLWIETPSFKVYSNKGEHFTVSKTGKRWLKVDDDNDAAILRSRRRLPLPD